MHKEPVAAGKSSFDLIDPSTFFSHLPLPAGAEVLDLACGAGRYSIEIARRVPSGVVHAVDLWEEGIASLQRSIAAEGIANIRTIRADITKVLPFGDGSIDLCLMATILHDLSPDEQDAVLREARRLLRPGGTLALIEFRKIDFGPGPPAGIRISEQEAEDLLGRHGFTKTYAGPLGEYTYLMNLRRN